MIGRFWLFWVINFHRIQTQCMFIYANISYSFDKIIGFICAKEKKDLRKQFHCRINAKSKIASSFCELFQEIYEMRSESVLSTLSSNFC